MSDQSNAAAERSANITDQPRKTLRDDFAMWALMSFAPNTKLVTYEEAAEAANAAYVYADAMMEARKE